MMKIHQLYLSKYEINVTNDMRDLPAMYWIQKMHKKSIIFHFILASPVCSIKPLSNDIKSYFQFSYYMKKPKDVKQKEKSGQESRPSGPFRIAPQ